MPSLRSHTARSEVRGPKIRKGGGRRNDDNIETSIGRKVEIQPDGCWRYTGQLTSGYGRHERVGAVHRFVYETLVGAIPDGHHLHHECENRACVNPAHLIPLTPAEHSRIHAVRRRES